MKWVVYALLAANLALLTWNLVDHGAAPAASIGKSTPAPEAGTAEGERHLTLLSELREDSLRLRAQAALESVPAESDEGAAADASAETSARAGAPEEPDRPPDRTPPVTPPQGDRPATPLRPTPRIPSDAPATAAAPSKACLTLGPVPDDAPVEDIQAWLEGRGAQVDVRTDERREVALYWIYFPPKPDRAEAVAQVERMRAEGISDVLVVPKGDQAGAISLGVFSRPETRDRRLRELNGKGYQPSIAPRYRTKLATWVDVTVEAGALAEADVAERWPELEVTRKPCGGGQIAGAVGGSYNPGDGPPGARRFFFSGQGSSRPGREEERP